MFTARAGVVLAAFAFLLNAQPTAPAPDSGLSNIKRLCVEKFAGEDQNAAQARETAMAALFSLKRFAITENCDKADAVLKGAVSERVGTKTRAESEEANFGSATGGASANRNSASAAVRAVGGGSSEGLYSSETRFQATVTLRITNRDGDLLWATSQDSPGGKVNSAVTDAVERSVKRLARELDKGAQKADSAAKP